MDKSCAAHAALLCDSYQRLLGRPLLRHISAGPLPALFHASFAPVSHGTEGDPVFTFANRSALELFEMSCETFTALPSRKSAEAKNREARTRLLEPVTDHGYIDDCSGVRLSSSGKRLLIEHADAWNLIDGRGEYHGQAAAFDNWAYV